MPGCGGEKAKAKSESVPLNIGLKTETGAQALFPDLRPHHIKSRSRVASYNCAAWAMGEKTRWWQPPPHQGLRALGRRSKYFWPENVSEEPTAEAFAEAFATRGYRPCADGNLEDGWEKIAIYGIPDPELPDGPILFQHAARQLPNGLWTSKLGWGKDITHTSLDVLCGEGEISDGYFRYGYPVIYMRRPRHAEEA